MGFQLKGEKPEGVSNGWAYECLVIYTGKLSKGCDTVLADCEEM